MKPQLIITADDFGASTIIDRGIIKAIEEGLITSIASFSNGDDEAFERVKKLHQEYGNKIDIGCHFNISSGPPLTPLSAKLTRTKDGKIFFKRLLNLNFNDNELKLIKKELAAQVARFEKAKIPIKHFSDHYGMISMFNKALFQCMLDVVKDYNNNHSVNVPVRIPMLWSLDTTNSILRKSKMKTNGRFGNFIRKSILDVEDEKFFQLFKPELRKRVKQIPGEGLSFVDYSIDQFFKATIMETVAFIKAFHRFAEVPKNKSSIPSPLSKATVFEMMAHISDVPGASEEAELKELKRYWKINKTSMRREKPFEFRRLHELFVPVLKNEGIFQLTQFSQIKL